MLGKIKKHKGVVLLLIIVLAIPAYFIFNDSQQSNDLKSSFEKHDRIGVLHRLLASEKYAKDIRKAGYIIPPDGAIRFDGGIDPLEIKGRLHLKISNPGKDSVTVFFETEIESKKTSVLYELDRGLNIVSAAFFQTNDQDRTERVSIPQSEEDRLLKIVQAELDIFFDKMYQTLYG